MDKDKKRGLAALIIEASPKFSKEKVKESSSDEVETSDEETAAGEILGAIESGDAKALSEALSAFIKLCENVENADEEDGEAGKSEFEY